MERLLNVVRGDTKPSVENIDKSKIFYADEIKLLKRDFGNVFYVSHTKLCELFDKPQIKANNCITLRNFHQKVKCVNTWLKSIEYLQTFLPNEYIVKAVKRLPNHLRSLF